MSRSKGKKGGQAPKKSRSASTYGLATDTYLEKERLNSSLNSAKYHAVQVRSQLHDDMEIFRKRFLKGYELLLEELFQQHKGGVRSAKDVPADAIKI